MFFLSSFFKRISIVAIFTVFAFSQIYTAKKTYGDIEIKDVVKVYDGDTIKVNIPQFHPIIGDKISIRIDGVDTPEIKDKNSEIKELAKFAKEYVETRLKQARKIVLKNMKRGKYFRIVANIELDGRDLTEDLISEGLAKRYDGGKKNKWTVNDVLLFWNSREKPRRR